VGKPSAKFYQQIIRRRVIPIYEHPELVPKGQPHGSYKDIIDGSITDGDDQDWKIITISDFFTKSLSEKSNARGKRFVLRPGDDGGRGSVMNRVNFIQMNHDRGLKFDNVKSARKHIRFRRRWVDSPKINYNSKTSRVYVTVLSFLPPIAFDMTSPEKSSSDTSNDKLTQSGSQLIIPSSAPGSTNEAVVESEASLKEQRAQEVHNHYILRFQKRDLSSVWVAYDPTNTNKDTGKGEEPEDSENYFYLNKRWHMANATPILVLSDFSKPLLHFLLRSTIGGKSFNEEPEIDIADFFPQLKSMRKKLEQICLAIESNSTEEKSELAKEMGKCD
ncbi:hypothetical protein K435DRAFT_814398, partial [Dendrothele bispora CBS 962.96]